MKPCFTSAPGGGSARRSSMFAGVTKPLRGFRHRGERGDHAHVIERATPVRVDEIELLRVDEPELLRHLAMRPRAVLATLVYEADWERIRSTADALRDDHIRRAVEIIAETRDVLKSARLYEAQSAPPDRRAATSPPNPSRRRPSR